MERECFATKKDIKRLFLRRRNRYLRTFILVSSTVLCFHLTSPPKYTAQATFRVSSDPGEQSDLLRSFLQNNRFSSGKEGGPQSIFESRTLVKQVAEELGLLAEEPQPFILKKWFLAAKDKVGAEAGLKIPDRRRFFFSNLRFAKEEGFDFFIRLTDTNRFEIYDADKKKSGEGTVGAPAFFQENEFTLNKVKSIDLGKFYKIRAGAWVPAVKNIRSRLKVKPGKVEKSVYALSFSDVNAEVASSFLNSLMKGYQSYLKKENEEMASAQMDYLERRQGQLFENYNKSLQEHTAFLREGLKDTGCIDLKQEIGFLEKPSEEYLSKLHELDLKLSRLKKYTPSDSSLISKVAFGEKRRMKDPEVTGLSPEVAEKICIDYSKERDKLRVNIEQLTSLLGRIFNPDFEVSSLSGILTDPVSREMIGKAGQLSLQLQDSENYSAKDMERMKNGLLVQKQFLSKHLAQLIEMEKLQSSLLLEKIGSLQETSANLLKEEKKLITEQLSSLQKKMLSLPEKWRRENQLVMQRELSVGMLEGLTQLTESKNVQHRLFYVDSKPIDLAYTPLKPAKGFIIVQAALAAAVFCVFMVMRDLARWLSKGVSVTVDSAARLGVAFCGFLPKFFSGSLKEIKGEEKETLRKVAAFIRERLFLDRGTAVSILSPSQKLSCGVAALLHLQGVKVLLIDCTPSVLQTGEDGLYDYLFDGKPPVVSNSEGFDRIAPGKYLGHFVELLFRKSFADLIRSQTENYDVVLLSLDAAPSDASVAPLKHLSRAMIIHAEDVFYEKPEEELKLAVVLTTID